MDHRPNVVVCMCDQLRAFEMGCYGNPVIRTPHLDRLAAEGVRFETAVTNYPVCMAARSVLLAGQFNRTCTGGVSNVSYVRRPGDFSMPQYPDAGRPHLKDVTLAERLRADGYRTAAIGKWHIHSWPHDVGFDEYYGLTTWMDAAFGRQAQPVLRPGTRPVPDVESGVRRAAGREGARPGRDHPRLGYRDAVDG
jgi:arylsulfatase A-like enzyme